MYKTGFRIIKKKIPFSFYRLKIPLKQDLIVLTLLNLVSVNTGF